MAIADIYKAFTFTPNGKAALLLNGALEAYDHNISVRLASFEYLKRNGAEVEPMGAAQGKYSYRCTFLGPAPLSQGGPQLTPGSRYQQLVAALLEQPRGILNDPRLGKIQAAFAGLRSSETPQRAVDVVDFTLDFVQDSVDVALAAETQIVPQQQGGKVLTTSAIYTAAIAARYASETNGLLQLVVSSTASYTDTAAAFVTAAVTASQNAQQNLALATQLGNVAAQLNANLAALAATTAFTLTSDVLLTPFRVQAREIYAGCIRLYYAVRAQLPPIVRYTVPATMPLGVLALRLYGADARRRQPEMLLLNRIPNPFAVPRGFEMIIAAPSQVQ